MQFQFQSVKIMIFLGSEIPILKNDDNLKKAQTQVTIKYGHYYAHFIPIFYVVI